MVLGRRSQRAGEEVSAPVGRPDARRVRSEHRVLGTPISAPFPDGMERLIVGMGCFWGVEKLFWEHDGVYTTAAGYSGGITPNPTYDETCTGFTGHVEVVQIVYDPRKVPIGDLLAAFWENHDPTTPYRRTGFTSQYRSVIFTTTSGQHAAALASCVHYQNRLTAGGYSRIHTEIAEAGEFYYAEDYHQQYMHTHPRTLCGTGFCQVSYT